MIRPRLISKAPTVLQAQRFPTTTEATPTRRDRIVAVDDVADNLFLLEALLGETPEYELICYEDSLEALAAVEANPPQLLLLDIMMPGLDGYEFTERIRRNPNLPYIPILLLTAHDEPKLVHGLDRGADEFIRKPILLDELSARVRALLRLKHSMDEQAAMIQQREDLVARLTHDLRTPLVAANRVLDMAVNDGFGTVPPPLREMLDNVIHNNANLLKMANNLLEVYRHDAGQKAMSFARFNLHALVTSVLRELDPLAQDQSLVLQFDSQHSLEVEECWMVGDSLEVRRVITNLIGNALKFTDAGHIALRCQESGPGYIQVEIEDTGVGISETDQHKIFDRFRQGQHLRAGSGLGLHLSQRIAEAHGGSITVASTPGQGSIFTVRLSRNA